VFAVRVARLPPVAQAAPEYPVLTIGALPVRLLALLTPILCDTAPSQLEPTLKHVPVSAACEVALVTFCHQNIASHWHGDNLAAVRGQLVHLVPFKLTSHEHEGVSWASIRSTLEPRAFDFECVKIWRHGIAAEEEGEVSVGPGVIQPCVVEADFVADCGAVAASEEHIAVHQ